MRNNNEINISFVSLNKVLMKIKSIQTKIFDQNTERFEYEIVKVLVFGENDEFNKIIGQICAKNHLNTNDREDKKILIEISKTFSVLHGLHGDTAMIAELKLDASKMTENEME